MQNNRQTTRHPVSVPATIESGQTAVGGVVLDVSATGARIRLASGAFLASQCVLTTALFAEAVPSRIVWRRGAEIGLRFRTTLNIKQELGAFRSRPFNAVQSGGFGRRAGLS
ncbi:PilZ domain-containing protein [Lichenihabitans sp. Uapishka_5]|uniref:PilZ domain-containing protein n=1 Tax=Lichenihabitans sp. Uapishka_5 TaxID=3037302 RepID=UPI0029E81D29|nr:PilZ domain-containing protein [Lichenihabitans sp. Uapishka_5]MDX7950769.1 PilZ domain-containing protein [Lichenihabitans sp. Uapishka_5]